VHVLIESLNEDGYLADTLEEIVAELVGDERPRRR
jgi:RNA polymerase sigma-54 factor